MNDIIKKQIKKMDYSQIVGLTKERNRPSGGIKTVHEVAVNAFIDSSKKMLEIGSNTGFTSVNMSLLTNCNVVGIDINKQSVKEAIKYAKQNNTSDKVKFRTATVIKLPFNKESFDVVWSSNVTSFIKNKSKAIKEYLRVLKYSGILVVVPIYYKVNPPKKVIRDVSKIIGVNIDILSKDDWINLFQKQSTDYEIELFYESNYKYINCEKEISEYVNMIMNKKHLNKIGDSFKKVLYKKYLNIMNLFNKNLKYAEYSILLFQKRKIKEEKELFLSEKIK